MEERGRSVIFAVQDIAFPTPGEVLMTLHSDDLLHGEVVDVSEGASETYVVVRVEGLEQPVVVPIDRIRQ